MLKLIEEKKDQELRIKVEEELVQYAKTLLRFHDDGKWDNVLETLHGMRQIIEYLEENTEYLKRNGIHKVPTFRFIGRKAGELRIFKPVNKTDNKTDNETDNKDDGVPVTVAESGAPLIMHEVKQQEWWKQWMEHIDHGIKVTGEPEYRRTIDRMSVAEISEMYKRGMHPCDTCDRELQLRASDLTTHGLAYHITHVINQHMLVGCDECMYDDYKNGRILAGDVPDEWRERLKKERECEKTTVQ